MAEQKAPTPPTLGRYKIIRRLGAGGMAEVFLAKSTGAEGIEKVLVVKRVLPGFGRSAKFIAMFLEEAKIATRLNHPNIVQVYAFEQVRGEFLLAMEFVDGLDVGRLVSGARGQHRRIPSRIAAFIVMEVAKGLDYAHKRKDEGGEAMEIVHRDVSPQNVLLSYGGAVKIADFGIAKARMVSEDTGVIKGKFSYMSPEQARGEPVDCRCDVYALGVLLAELLMGRSMYPKLQGLDVLEKVRKGEITYPEEVRKDIPPELAAIVRRATVFDREERFQTARSLAGALGQYLHGQEAVVDAVTLERFIAELVPREQTSQEAIDLNAQHAATEVSVVSPDEAEKRERRHVVVVSGVVRSQDDSEGIGQEAARVLGDIAFKADAVFSWVDDERRHFRFILGMRRASVHDPLSAVRVALDVIEALHGLSADMVAPLFASLGVSRGIVSTVRDRSGRLLRSEPVGSVLDVSDGLAEEGRRGEVLAAGEVYRLVRRTFAFDEEAERSISVTSGVAEEVQSLRAYSLRGSHSREERGAQAMATPGAEGLIGRADELESVTEAYEEAVTGRRNVSLAVTGELGVGKTSFVAAAVESLTPKPRVLHSQCAFGTGDVPFAMVSELVREALSIPDDAGPTDAVELLRKGVKDLVADSRDRETVLEGLEPLLAPDVHEDEHPEGADRPRIIMRASRLLLASLAAREPLVVWVDGLQWADTPSMEIMASLLVEEYEVPLMAVFSTRAESRSDRALSAVPHIELGELDQVGRRELIRSRFEGAEVPDDVEEAIIERAGGNPFFIVELVEALIDRGVVSVEEGDTGRRVVLKPGVAIALPTTLEGVVASRLDELTEDERRAVRWLAAVGSGHTVAELSRIAGVDLSNDLSTVEKRGIVKRDGTVYRFTSAVIRHVAYETTDEEDRVRMHRRIGSWLASVKAPPGRIARHLERAGEGEEAAEAYLRAGARARVVYSNREALRFFGRALSLMPGDSPRRFFVHEAREQILRGMGRPFDQVIELEAMRALAERGGDTAKVAMAYNRLARYELDSARTEGVSGYLERALASAVAARDKGAEVEALRLRALLAREVGDSTEALSYCDKALVCCGLDKDLLAARGSVLVQKAILLRRAGRLPEALEANAEGIVIFRRLGIKRNEGMAFNALGVALASLGEWEDSMAFIRRSLELDREIGDRMFLGKKLSNLGQLLAELGDVRRAREFLERADQVFATRSDQPSNIDNLCALAEVILDSGVGFDKAVARLDDAKRIAERSHDNYDRARERIVRARLEILRGEDQRAVEAARGAVELCSTHGILVYETPAKAYLAESLARKGEAEEARELVSQLTEAMREETIERAERVYLCLARTMKLLGDNAGATRALAEAYSLVEGRLAQIRTPELRETYMRSPTVQAIRGAL